VCGCLTRLGGTHGMRFQTAFLTPHCCKSALPYPIRSIFLRCDSNCDSRLYFGESKEEEGLFWTGLVGQEGRGVQKSSCATTGGYLWRWLRFERDGIIISRCHVL
jgi:hypothetical protein